MSAKIGNPRPLPSREFLRELFDYSDGDLIWKVKWSRKVVVGAIAGGALRRGYWGIRIDGRRYFAHRLVWQWHHGDYPEELDHIDCDPSNNRIENLREVTHHINMCNRRMRGYYRTPAGRYVVQFLSTHRGVFNTEEAARSAYLRIKEEYIAEQR